MATASNPLDPNADPNEEDPNALLDPTKGFGATAAGVSGGDVGPNGGFANPRIPGGIISGGMSAPEEMPSPITPPEGGSPGTPTASGTASVTPPTPMTANTYTPTLQTVQPNQTVSGQVTDLLKADNPLMQTARTHAAEAANSRGLLNSSMGVQAGEQAAIESALPIASADAQTYNRVGSENAAAQNQSGQFNAGSQNQFNLSAQQAGQDQALQTLRGNQAKDVANIEAQYKTLMQTNASAASVFNEYQKNVSSLLDDPNTTAEQKQAAVDKLTQVLQASLSVMGGVANLDLAGLLDFTKLGQVAQPGTPGAPPSSPSIGAHGGPAPAGTPGAGHNVGDTFVDPATGTDVVVHADGSIGPIDLGTQSSGGGGSG